MSIVAHTRPFVIGVDAHARTHAIAILACPTGELIDESQFPATAAGLGRAVAWVARRTGADLATLWGPSQFSVVRPLSRGLVGRGVSRRRRAGSGSGSW